MFTIFYNLHFWGRKKLRTSNINILKWGQKCSTSMSKIIFLVKSYSLKTLRKETFFVFFEPKKSEKHITFINFTDHMSLCLATFHVEIYFDSLFQALENIFHCEVQIVWKENFKKSFYCVLLCIFLCFPFQYQLFIYNIFDNF